MVWKGNFEDVEPCSELEMTIQDCEIPPPHKVTIKVPEPEKKSTVIKASAVTSSFKTVRFFPYLCLIFS